MIEINIPNELIATHPCLPRTAAKLLQLNPDGQLISGKVNDLPKLLQPNDILIYNNCRVINARLFGYRIPVRQTSKTAASPPPLTNQSQRRLFEVLLLTEQRPRIWQALAKPLRKLTPGDWLSFAPDFTAQVIDKQDGMLLLQFNLPSDELFFTRLQKYGTVPLPPYLKRQAEVEDIQSYQTIFAGAASKITQLAAVAAPTAGLHFDSELIAAIAKTKATLLPITLRVSGGTFLPPTVQQRAAGKLHHEWFCIPADTWRHIMTLKQHKNNHSGRIIAIGTTSVRALETAVRAGDQFVPGKFIATDIYIRAPFQFKLVDVLMTNFHLPKSSLLELVGAFIGENALSELYQYAINHRFRFFSYGDACWLQPHKPIGSPG